jgi:hypothetical protein
MFCYLIYFLFLNTNNISIRFDYILCDTMSKLVDCVNCNFYVETDSYVICFKIKFRMDNSCYDVSCILMITNV